MWVFGFGSLMSITGTSIEYYWDIHHLNNDQPAFLNCFARSLPPLPIVFGVFGSDIRGQWGSGDLN